VIPSLRQAGKAFTYHDKGPEQAVEFSPAQLGIDEAVLAPPIPDLARRERESGDQSAADLDTAALARAAAQAGLAALSGRSGPTRDSLVCGGALCLWHLKRNVSLQSAAAAVRQVLDSGQALERIERARE
jgi:anthranilate phosphoribosyltransferase